MCIQYSTYVCLYSDVRRVCRPPAAVLHIKMTVRKFKKEIKNLITNIVFRWLGCSDLSWTEEGGHAAKHNSVQIEIKSTHAHSKLKPFHMTDNSMFVASVGLLSSSLWRLSWFYIMTAQGGGACVLCTRTDGRNSSCFYHLLRKALTQDLCIIHLHIHYVLHVGNKSYIMSQRCTCVCSLNHLKRPKTTLSCEASLHCSYCKAADMTDRSVPRDHVFQSQCKNQAQDCASVRHQTARLSLIWWRWVWGAGFLQLLRQGSAMMFR